MQTEERDHLDDFLKFNQSYKKAGFFKQVRILLEKNIIVTCCKLNFVMAHLITLTLVCVVIMFINFLTRYSYENEPSRIYDIEPVTNIEKCDFDPSCKSFGYVLIGEWKPWINYTLEDIATKSGLSIKDDFKLLYKGENVTQAFIDIKKNNSNSFSTITILCTSSFKFDEVDIPCNKFGVYSYWLLYNQTLVKQNFLDNMNAPLKLSMAAIKAARMVENAISTFALKNDYHIAEANIEHNYTSQDYPKVQSRMLIDFDTSSSQGPFWFFIPIMVSFLNLNTEIINEKERKLRQGLMLFGISSGAYWISWILYTIGFDLVYAGLITLSGYLCRFSFFVNCPFYLLYTSFFATLLSNHMLGLFLCTLVADNKSGSKYGYSIMLISIFYQIFFSNGMFLELIYTDDKPWGIIALYYFMYINPSFHFANIVVNIIYKAGNHFNNYTMQWEKGDRYTWNDFTTAKSGNLFGRSYHKPAPLSSLVAIGYTTIGFVTLLWFFDSIIASNRGFSSNPITEFLSFLCRSIFFCCKKADAKLVQVSDNEGNPMDDKSDQILRNVVAVKDEKSMKGIVMKDLSKSYKIACNRGKDLRNDWALRNVNLEIRKGELLGLLGPNGAGKTTMIGIISGILKQTQGEFFSNGLNANSNREAIRMFTNVCPQFDILWGELTVKDHIDMVCKIKGVNAAEIPALASTLLSIVNLSHTLNDRISSLSGGMKRRISIALACIGNPTILVFDEPTTGLDPENRRIIWKFINKLKESNRTILLTTHLLEEADLLSDRIAIMSYGQIKCIGTSSELKRENSSGFKLNIIIKETEEEAVETIKKFVTDHISEVELLDESAGALMYSIPFNKTDQITEFLRLYEQDGSVRALIDDIAISNSTLEEVFIKVTKEDDPDIADAPLVLAEQVQLKE